MRRGRAFEIIARRIRTEGALSVADYMSLALAHPQVGYYATRDPFGGSGDFITAPEISQVFGELLGLWCAERWQAMGEPQRVLLVELGPGRGTLMADALRAAQLLPAFRAAIEVHLVETSPYLRQRQKDALQDVDVTWHSELASLPEAPLLLLANEFFDALPIRQYQKTSSGWAERLIGLNEDGESLRWGLGPVLPPVLPLPAEAPPGAIAEVSSASTALVRDIARHLGQHDGAALIIDYGYSEPALGDTFQAVQQHRPVPPLHTPGDADLTAHVDFPALAAAAASAGARPHGPVEQGTLLKALGIRERTEQLAAAATPPQRRQLLAALDRLTSPAQMGRLFKALALTAAGSSTPAGFPEAP